MIKAEGCASVKEVMTVRYNGIIHLSNNKICYGTHKMRPVSAVNCERCQAIIRNGGQSGTKPLVTFIDKRVEMLEKGVCTNCNKLGVERSLVSADLVRGKIDFDYTCAECGYEITVRCTINNKRIC